MLSLAGRYDPAVLVSGDEDFVYAVNAVAYKGCRVEVAGFRSNTAPKLIDVADYFIDLGEIAEKVRKEASHAGNRYYEHHPHHDEHPPTYMHNGHDNNQSQQGAGVQLPNGGNASHAPSHLQPPANASGDNHREIFDAPAARAIAENGMSEDDIDPFPSMPGFIRVTDDQ
jgi:hypothetical protein